MYYIICCSRVEDAIDALLTRTRAQAAAVPMYRIHNI